MMQRLENALALVLFVSGLLAIGVGARPSSHMRTEGTQQITDVRYGLDASPFYWSHLEEPVGGAKLALDQGRAIHIVRERSLNWLSWSCLLLASGIVATTLGLLMLARRPRDESR